MGEVQVRDLFISLLSLEALQIALDERLHRDLSHGNGLSAEFSELVVVLLRVATCFHLNQQTVHFLCYLGVVQAFLICLEALR